MYKKEGDPLRSFADRIKDTGKRGWLLITKLAVPVFLLFISASLFG